VQAAFATKLVLEAPGPRTLHVFPLTVSVRQYDAAAAEATVSVLETPWSIATSLAGVRPTYEPPPPPSATASA
jgi:hypothetical protein